MRRSDKRPKKCFSPIWTDPVKSLSKTAVILSAPHRVILSGAKDRFLTAALVACVARTTLAQTDSSHRKMFTWEDAALGGAFVVATVAIRPLDKSAALALQAPTRQQNQ